MTTKVTADNYPEIIDVYHKDGKKAAYDLVRNKYGIQYPECLLNRMKKKKSLRYDPETDRFLGLPGVENDLFLSMEELCEHKSVVKAKTVPQTTKAARAEAMENMVHTLISDRLLELSRYVLLDPVDRKILISRSSMQADGYYVVVD